MGSGCNNNCNVFNDQISDQRIRYTGPALTSLGICTGDTLAEIEYVLLQKIVSYATGVGISIPSIDLTTGNCATLFSECITCCGSCTDLPCLLGCYHTALCTLYDDVTTLQTQMTAMQSGYNTVCLTGVNSSSSIHDVLQELLVEFCNLVSAFNVLSTSVSGFQSGIATTIANFLATAITSNQQGPGLAGPNITSSGTGSAFQLNFIGFCPPGVVLPYAGNTSNFSSGLGLANTPVYGWAIANGQSHNVAGITYTTVNMMGQVPVGLTTMGGSLPSNASALAGKFVSVGIDGTYPGEATHTLISSEIPSVGVSGTVNEHGGHDHALFFKEQGGHLSTPGPDSFTNLSYPAQGDNTGASAPFVNAVGGSGNGLPTAYISKSTTGITLDNLATSGGGQSHNNMQPSTGLLYIQRLF